MTRNRLLLSAVLALAVVTVAAGGDAELEKRLDTQVRLNGNGFRTPDFGFDDDDWINRGTIDLIVDGLFTTEYSAGKPRLFQLTAGGRWFEGRQSGTFDLDPTEASLRLTLDGDLPFGDSEKRFTLGLLGDWRALEIGSLDVDRRLNVTGAFMYTWKADGRCELRTVTGFYGTDRVDDEVNPGDAALDRSGTYRTVGAEVFVLLGEIPEAFPCERLGPFRQFDRYRNTSIHVGLESADESTDGTVFDADRQTLYGRGWVPFWREGKSAKSVPSVLTVFEWAFDYGQTDFTSASGRTDKLARLEAGVRWGFAKRDVWANAIKNLDLRVAATGERRTSTDSFFEYDTYGLFVGLWMRFGHDADGGPGTQGSSVVGRRTGSGGSDPKVPSDVTPSP